MPESLASRGRQSSADVPPRLRPYSHWGAYLDVRGGHGVGACPFCGRDGKFSACVDTGLWRCFVCGGGAESGGGNALSFIRLLWERAGSVTSAEFLSSVAEDRCLLSPETVGAWGIRRSPLDGSWMVPGFGPDLVVDQLYRRTWMGGAWILLPTPGVWPEGRGHAFHAAQGDWDAARADVDVLEGPHDGMVFWEVSRSRGGPRSNVMAVPGCNVWRDEWTEMCRNKRVTLWYDSDHPRDNNGTVSRAGYDGMRRVARKLAGTAMSVRWLRWGPDGYDPAKPHGWDVRDELSGSADRLAALEVLSRRVEDVPAEWCLAGSAAASGYHAGSEVLPCETWAECEASWDAAKDGALEWRQELSDATAVLLAVCASTQQAGNQLFVDLIGSPGSAKTTLCRGLLASRHCIHLENATKILSGFVKPGEAGKDCSFLARANGKTWVTCEFDTLGTLRDYHELMGKIRRIFDGETSATYGNRDEDRIYTALRTPWIRAGTPKMMDHDQSQLGDRFLRFIISDPTQLQKRSILRAALRSERAALVEQADHSAGSLQDARTRRAHAMTGGYVDWLRARADDLVGGVDVPTWAEDRCMDLAELSADLRARPTPTKRDKDAEAYDCKELPSRLARQNVRLATFLAVVLNKRVVDADVMRVVRKVALDTACGTSLNVVQWLCSTNPRGDGLSYQECGGLMNGILGNWTNMSQERLNNYLTFLQRIDVVRLRPVSQGGDAWVLTNRVHDLYLQVTRD